MAFIDPFEPNVGYIRGADGEPVWGTLVGGRFKPDNPEEAESLQRAYQDLIADVTRMLDEAEDKVEQCGDVHVSQERFRQAHVLKRRIAELPPESDTRTITRIIDGIRLLLGLD